MFRLALKDALKGVRPSERLSDVMRRALAA